jgi:hypothetical protein
VPTPVGPVPRDPNDPDFWDWEVEEERSAPARHPGRTILAVLLALALVILVVSVAA